ncbi:MAG: hexapeptide transferase [Dorea sp.]|jgi:hypothetical protein|nr:hexapeptide transferase [Dorea sp.]
MRSSFRSKWDRLNFIVESVFRKHKYTKRGKERIKRMNGGYACRKEYESIVVPFWKRFGYKPDRMWFQIYCDREKKIEPRYMPDDLYYGELVPYFSNTQFRRFAEDKCYHDVWFNDLIRPNTVCKNIAGVFYNEQREIIQKEQAISLCIRHESEIIVKPSIDSGEGRLIHFFHPKKDEASKLKKILSDMKANFIVQDVLKQHSVLERMNPSSLNTIRVVSFLFEGEVHILSTILRIGAENARVDNIGAGGFACPIHKDGRLFKKGVNRKAEWVEQNARGIKFSEITVPALEKVIEIIKRKHKILAHFKIIGWDFSIDQDENPVFIEYNLCPGQNQITCGPTFGDLTERVLEEYFIKKTLSSAQN